MRKKGKARKLVSGCLALVSLLSTTLSPVMTYAADPAEERIPYYEEVKEQLDADEVVTAQDYEVEVGSSFDIASDFPGLRFRMRKSKSEFP